MSDTPKTEEVLIECIGRGMNIAPLADWARQLETALVEITHAGTVAWARRRAERALDTRAQPPQVG